MSSMLMQQSFRTIPLIDLRRRVLQVEPLSVPVETTGWVLDQLGRPLRDLRISVTDRCNFRCNYCMPKEKFGKDYPYLARESVLSLEEIVRLARQFVAQGVQKIRLTGGEPLLRKNIESLIEQLSDLRTPEGHALDIALTTNGSLLATKAKALRRAGLNRVTVSLDSLNDTIFRHMNGVEFPVSQVLKGLSAAHDAGFSGVKVNMVVKRGTNDQEILPMARHFRGTGFTLRFIEYMDVGASNGWERHEVLPSAEVLQRLQSEMNLVQMSPTAPGETAERWGYCGSDGVHDPLLGEIGLISSVSKAFCGDCNRARLSTDGKLFLCLFSGKGYDLREYLRCSQAISDDELQAVIFRIWKARADRYSEERCKSQFIGEADHRPRVEMSYIGG